MGRWADLLLGKECKYCGSRSLKKEGCEGTLYDDGDIKMRWCESCHGVATYGCVPRCVGCGTPQTRAAQNEYGVWIPKCPKCGHMWYLIE